MPNAQAIIDDKKGNVVCIHPTASVLEAAGRMTGHSIGALIVHDGEQMVGIFTERDILRRIVAAGLDPAKTPVGDVMSSPVACAGPGTTGDELRTVVRERRIRHIPVVEDGVVKGVISIGDLNRVSQKAQQDTIRYLEQYISVA